MLNWMKAEALELSGVEMSQRSPACVRRPDASAPRGEKDEWVQVPWNPAVEVREQFTAAFCCSDYE